MTISDVNGAAEDHEGAGEKLSDGGDGGASGAADAAGEVIPQHGSARSIVLHLVPGAIATAIYVGLVPFAERAGYPPLAAMIVGIVAGAIPFELGVVLLAGERLNGRWSFDGVIFSREAWPAARYFKVVPAIVLLCIVGYGLGLPLDRVWHRVAFSWLPGWYVFSNLKQYAGYGRNVLLTVFAGRLVFDALLIPIVEEIYFRGFLLPRISRFGGWSMWINCGLFAIYHFWSPYSLPTIFLASLPVVAATWMTGNYRAGMAARIVVSVIGGLLAISGVMHLPR
jgi:membrane protease YdiL (CAAX protease family)